MGRGVLAEMCGADNTWPGNKLQAAGEGGGINPEAFATTTPARLEERHPSLQDEGFSAKWPLL